MSFGVDRKTAAEFSFFLAVPTLSGATALQLFKHWDDIPTGQLAWIGLGSLVLILAGLSFIGLGSPPPAPELGAMAARGMPYLFGHPWIPLAPAIAVFLLAFAANLAGDGLRDLLEDH